MLWRAGVGVIIFRVSGEDAETPTKSMDTQGMKGRS